MRKTICLFLPAIMLCGVFTVPVSAQTTAVKNNLTTARQLYDAGEWKAARYEFESAPQSIESETFAALCAARLSEPDAVGRLEALLEKYPGSTYSGEVRLRAGVSEHDAGNYGRAIELLSEINARHLPVSDRDEFRFTLGHSYFAENGSDARRNATRYFEQIAPESEYAPHADYFLAYMDYEAGDYAPAKRRFAALASHPSYRTLAPYYILQIEFLEGNYRYVTENVPPLVPQTAMPRKAELVRMAAQSHWELGEWGQVLENIETYRALGGEMSREENYLAGFSLYREGRSSEAAEYLSRAVGVDDALSQNASYHLGDIYLRTGDKMLAMQSFSIASTSGHNPEIAEDALFNYGKLLYETGAGRFNEAVNVLNRYLDTYPSSPRAAEARDYLIAAYYNSHDYEAAYNAILKHPNPDNDVRAALQKITYFRALELWNGGDATGALELLDVSSRNRYSPKYSALAAFWQGEILYSQENYDAAAARFEEYLRTSPTTEAENAMARYDLGYIDFNRKRWSAARDRFDDFLERYTAQDAYRADAFNRKGDIDHAERAYWRAIENYDAAARVGTDQKYYSAYQRAMMLGLVDRPERKIESLQAIISSGVGDYVEDATYELGRTYITRDDYSSGARTLAGFISKYPDSQFYLPALSNLGLAWLNMGDGGQSMRYYKMIVERAPWSREAQDAMAGIRGIYVDRGDVDGYFAYAEKAGVSTDTGVVQRDSLTFAAAERMYLAGDGARALPALESYVGGDARGRYIPTALGYLAELYSKASRHSEAADTYYRLISAAAAPSGVNRALEGWTRSTVATKNPARIVVMADELAGRQGVPESVMREALFAKAGVLREQGKAREAYDIYVGLSGDVRTAEGAQAAYRVIEYLYDEGDYASAEDAIYKLSESGSPHNYWLAEAFLTLGDIYIHRGDTFQARATFQSIVDGYSPSDDGIIAAANERIANL